MNHPVLSPITISLRNILVATDLSRQSEAALGIAIGIARRYQSSLSLFNCVDPLLYNFVGPDAVTEGCEATLRDLKQFQRTLTAKGLLDGVPTKLIVVSGDISEALGKLVAKQPVDLIVIGTHGRTGWNKLVLGSTAEKIFRHAKCPVLTAGVNDQSQLQRSHPKSILFATDLSSRSLLAQSYAFSLADKCEAELTIVHALAKERDDTVGLGTRYDSCRQQLDQQIASEPALSKPPEFVLDFASPAELILETAERTKAELIVLAVREPHQLGNRIHSSTAYQVVRASRAAVLTVRP